ncbi:MAG: DNA polymerase III subunit alpha, partial [Schleiferiaceae bacterium]|nr:DNA polymerase III subunit alpha [Schleiferiaceae bacterium]
MYLIFDTETTGLPRNWGAPLNDLDNWPRVIQIAWQLHDVDGALIEAKDYLIQPRGFNIPFKAQDIHGISTDLALRDGLLLEEVIQKFVNVLARTKFLIGHNLKFDTNVLGAEFIRAGINPKLLEMPVLDTCTPRSAQVTKIKGRGNSFKIPKLSELHIKLFDEEFKEAHNATADVEASARCFWELVRLQHWSHDELGWDQSSLKKFQDSNKGRIKPIGLVHINFKEESALISNSINQVPEVLNAPNALGDINIKESEDFFHLHTHSQFSVLQATAKVSEMVQRVVDDGQSALGITDIGNMMGAFQFIKAVGDYNRSRPNGGKELKAIIGYEAYVCRNRDDKSQKDDGYQIPLLAKNKLGYHNLARLSSAAYIEGFYYVPRIDKKILLENKEGLMVTTGGLNGEIPQLILQVGEKQAEEAFLWFKNEFGSDFYAEINRHGLPEEDIVNETLLRFCSSHNVKPVAANNAFYLDQSEAEAHDILLCVKDNEKRSTPIGRGKGFRYGFPNDQFYLTTKKEMSVKFSDIPFALSNLQDLLDKVDNYPLARQVLLPKFEIPLEFLGTKNNKEDQKSGENEYLKHLTYLGAERRYGNVTDEIKERIDFELETIKKTGYPGYFLIVQDFCNAAREMNVTVGPGRGSAAGSAVAYCIGITNVDPISYNLLFERFLNPDRVSLPDIDIDFDDRGRDRVIQYVIDKYGSSQVAQIITYGKMAAKSSIKDAARALDLSFDQADKLTKTVPDNQSLANVLGPDDKKIREQLNGEDYKNAKNLREFYKADDNNGETLRQAKVLEGSLRNTGIHACGVIITPSDIRDLIPVAVAKDSEMWCTQFDNAAVESAGLLKMDFLGLKTLTIIKDAVLLVKKRHTISLEME